MILKAIPIVAVIAGLLAAASARAQAYRIMPVGDSITAGYTDNPTWTVPFGFGYRSGLYTRLTQSGLPFTFVGTSPEPFDNKFGTPQSVASPDLRTTNNTFDANQDRHEGYGGQGTAFVNNHIASWLTIDKPDVVLLMIGINDIAIGSATAPASAKTNLNNIVQTITTQRPNADVIVAQITPYSSYTPAIVDYNLYIRDTLVPAFTAQGKHVTTVDQYSNFGSGTTVDASLYANGINHPSAAGYDKMAQTWFAGIQSLNLPTRAARQPNLSIVEKVRSLCRRFTTCDNLLLADDSWRSRHSRNRTRSINSQADRLDDFKKLDAEYKVAESAYFEARQNNPDTSPAQNIRNYETWPGWQYLPRFVALAEADPTDDAAYQCCLWIRDRTYNVGNLDQGIFAADQKAWQIIASNHAKGDKLPQLCLDATLYPGPAREDFLRTLSHNTALTKEHAGFAKLALAELLVNKCDYLEAVQAESKRSQAEDRKFMESRRTPEGVDYLATQSSADLRTESSALFHDVLDHYSDVPCNVEKAHFRRVATLGKRAEQQLYALEHLVVGAEAPEIVGSDLDGKPLKLSAYRGRVVLLSFWFTGCGPCMGADTR